MNRTIRAILSWWLRSHPPCARIPAWKAAQEAERRARLSGSTRALGRARRQKQAAILANLAGRA